MSIPQTQIKGTVVLNSDAGAGLTIGNATATNSITGTTTINTSGTANTTIGVVGSTTALLGAVDINVSGTAQTTIGNAGSTTRMLGTINMNPSGGQPTNIGSGSSTTTLFGPININVTGANTTTIGTTAAPTTINSNTITIGTTTSNIALGALTGAGITTLNKPLTTAFAYPVASTHIGYTVYDTVNAIAASTNGFNNLTDFITLSAGVWLINYGMKATSPSDSIITVFTVWGNESVDTSIFYSQNNISEKTVTTRELGFTGTFVVVSTGSNTYRIRSYSTYSGGTLTFLTPPAAEYCYVKRTRIA